MVRAYNTVLLFLFLVVLSVESMAQSEGRGNLPADAQPNIPPAGYASLRQQAIDEDMLYSESIFLVSNYSGFYTDTPEEMSLADLLRRGVEGFSFLLKEDETGRALLLKNPNGTFSSFAEALSLIKESLDRNPNNLMTLFLDYEAETTLFEQTFREAGLLDYLFEYDNRGDWPTLKSMVESNKRLVVFEVRNHMLSPDWIHDLGDYAIGMPQVYTENDNVTAELGEESFESRLSKSLYIFTGYRTQYLPGISSDNINTYVRQTPYLIELFKRAWMREGRIPNFILFDRFYPWLRSLLSNFRQFNLVHGSITYNNELVSYVNWQGMNNYTSGKFTFPLESGGELSLDPKIPGYRVIPPRISVTNPDKKVYITEFELKPLPVDDNLKVYMPFDNDDVKDYSYSNNNGAARNIDYIFDPIRGQVASFNEQSRIDLPPADKLQVKDHDFTVAVWLKIPRYTSDKRDYSIMGTKNNAYQRGLHFLIRDRKPYMGFFNNDLEGNTMIEAGKWYHIAYRYNKLNGEQSIFVNGKLDAISFDRPAYLGSDTLYIGYSGLSSSSDFVGVMDNFSLWSRVLSDKEILGLSNQLIDLNESSAKRRLNALLPPLFYLFIAICVLAAGFFSYKYFKRRKAKRVAEEDKTIDIPASNLPSSLPKEKPQKNYIRLFGDFYVLDAEGVNITSSFTPKLKQLFFLIMLYSQQDKTGIQSNELTNIVWGEDNVKSMKSLRSVSILKLRKILERLDKVEIIFNANKYAIAFSENVYCDYLICLKALNETKIRSKADFEIFFEIISKGEIFKGESFDWLDDFKGYICNSIVDVLSQFIGKYSLNADDDMIIKIADQILLNDPSNEEALVYKVKALVNQNNTKSAKYAYDKFCSLYFDMYGENFPQTFEKVLEME